MTSKTELLEHLRKGNTQQKLGAWGALSRLALDERDLALLHSLLKLETDLSVRTFGIVSLLQATMPPGRLGWSLWDSFRVPSDAHAAVIGICDRQHIRDVQSLVILARYLSKEHFPQTDFHHIPLETPPWGAVGLDKLSALCVIGRPTMFRGSGFIDGLQKKLRFGFDQGSGPLWQPLTETSKESFHCVQQRRPKSGPRLHKAYQFGDERHDFALVQRFRVSPAGRDLTVVIVAGASSLGTFAATEWAIDPATTSLLNHAANRVGYSLDEATSIEVLLKVSAEVRRPAEPWKDVKRQPLKVFFDKSVNALAPPQEITLGLSENRLVYVLLDEDEVEFSGIGYDSLCAICVAANRAHSRSVPVATLVNDHSLWPAGRSLLESDNAVAVLRENVRRDRLREAITITANAVELHCELNVREVSAE